jgi:hypothetical protein
MVKKISSYFRLDILLFSFLSRSLIYFELIFISPMRYAMRFIYSTFPALVIEKFGLQALIQLKNC